MSKPNKQEILDCINNMKAVCGEGRKEIKGLVEKIIGEPLTTQLESFQPGDIISCSTRSDGVVVKVGDKYAELASPFGFVSNPQGQLMSYEDRLEYYRSLNAKKIGHIRFEIVKD